VWHDKDPSLLKDPKRRALDLNLQTFTGNGDVSMSEQMWHNKDTSLLKGPERRAKA
jgi:hypothetical protein